MGSGSHLSDIYNAMPSSMRAADDAEVRALHQKWKETGSETAMNIIVNSFIPLCIGIARKTSRNYNLNDDAYQELEQFLMIKLRKKIESFDPKAENLFHTYAAKSLNFEASNFTRKYFGLTNNKHRYLFANLNTLKHDVFAAHLGDPLPLSRARLNEEIIARAEEKITEEDIVLVERLISKIRAGEIQNAVEDIHQLTEHLDDYADTYPAGEKPEKQVIAMEQESFMDSFAKRASLHLDPVGWYIIKRNIMDDDQISLLQIARDLDMPIKDVQRKLSSSLDKLKDLFDNPALAGEKTNAAINDFLDHTTPAQQTETSSPLQNHNTNDGRRGSPLTIDMIIEGADKHREIFGHPPSSNDRREIEFDPLKGEKWLNIDYALKNGLRDLHQREDGLSGLLIEYDRRQSQGISPNDILGVMLIYRNEHHGEWPEQRTPEPVAGGFWSGKSWAALDRIHSLYQLRLEYEATYTKADVKESIRRHIKKHDGKRPTNKIIDKIDDGTKLSGYSWNKVDKFRIEGMTLSEIYKEYQAERAEKHNKPLRRVINIDPDDAFQTPEL